MVAQKKDGESKAPRSKKHAVGKRKKKERWTETLSEKVVARGKETGQSAVRERSTRQGPWKVKTVDLRKGEEREDQRLEEREGRVLRRR